MGRAAPESVAGNWITDWGPYRGNIADAVARCGDYSQRVKRSLGCDIPSDPRYVGDKALGLAEAAQDLAEHCREVERWLAEQHRQRS